MTDADHDFVQRNGRERRGFQDGNDRVARIARWLKQNGKLSANVPELVLECTAGNDEEPEIVARWERGHVLPELAPEINRLIQDQADDRRTTISARLFWAREDGSAYISKGFRAACSDDAREIVRPMDGSLVSVIQMMQRHNEAFASQISTMAARAGDIADRHDARFEQVLAIQAKTIASLLEQRDSAEDKAVAARTEAEQAVELAVEAAEQAEKAVKEAEAKGEQDHLAQVIEIGMKQLISGGSAK